MCIYHVFIHFSIDGHLDCFHLLAVVIYAAMGVQISSQDLALNSFLYITSEVELLDYMVTLFLIF